MQPAAPDSYDYYDPNPTVALDRPLVICGMIPFESRKLGYRLAALHGLRFADLERSIEHRMGASSAELARRELPHQLRRTEGEMLSRALLEAPFGVLVISDSALSKRAGRRLVEERSFFVALEYSAEDCYRRFHELYRDTAPNWIADAKSAGQMASMYRQWTERFGGADLVLPMAGLSWESAASALLTRLSREHSAFAAN
jgi:shikimate kinase